MEIRKHLEYFGILHFENRDQYSAYCHHILGENIEEFHNQCLFLQNKCRLDSEAISFFDYAASQPSSGLFWSQTAGTIAEVGSAIGNAIAGRMRILDLGCHIGHLTSWYARVAPERHVIGIDFSSESIKEARRHAHVLGLSNVEYLQHDISHCSATGEFDAIVDLRTLIYVPNRDAAILNLISLLKPGGLFVTIPTSLELAQTSIELLHRAGLTIRSVDIYSCVDLGDSKAIPIIVAEARRPALLLENIYRRLEFARLLQARGIGCLTRGDALYVSHVAPDSKAAKAGVRPGDQIVEKPGESPGQSEQEREVFFFGIRQAPQG